jgi:hypothetical protein
MFPAIIYSGHSLENTFNGNVTFRHTATKITNSLLRLIPSDLNTLPFLHMHFRGTL